MKRTLKSFTVCVCKIIEVKHDAILFGLFFNLSFQNSFEVCFWDEWYENIQLKQLVKYILTYNSRAF